MSAEYQAVVQGTADGKRVAEMQRFAASKNQQSVTDPSGITDWDRFWSARPSSVSTNRLDALKVVYLEAFADGLAASGDCHL